MDRLSSLAIMLLCLLIFGSWLQAADEKKDKKPEEAPTADVDPVGKWPKYQPGLSRRYQIWYDDEGWHLHTTTATEKHHFQGSIHVEGGNFAYFSGGQRLETKKSKNKDYGYFDLSRTAYTFDFTTQGHEDALHFKLSAGAKRLFFNLKVDGKEQPELIYIGKKSEHPPKALFYLPAFPGKK